MKNLGIFLVFFGATGVFFTYPDFLLFFIIWAIGAVIALTVDGLEWINKREQS